MKLDMCPFCYEENDLLHEVVTFGNSPASVVVCGHCGASGPPVPCHSNDDAKWEIAIKKASEHWNKRSAGYAPWQFACPGLPFEYTVLGRATAEKAIVNSKTHDFYLEKVPGLKIAWITSDSSHLSKPSLRKAVFYFENAHWHYSYEL